MFDQQNRKQKTENRKQSLPPGLYLHIPFCLSKCPYCDFASVTDLTGMAAWLDAAPREMAFYRDSFGSFDTLYLGGGTPSLLTDSQLAALMDALRRHFSFADDTEITLEANPDDLTPAKAAAWRELGVNRLSLGIQSFDERELAFLGRRHSARQGEPALKWCRAAGFDNLGIDLIYGLPGQSDASWLKTLKTALSYRPEHLSCYQLTLEKGTPLGRRLARGEIRPLGEEAESALFLQTSEFLEGQGYLHYEISNFALGEAHYSRHNRKYWQHAPYLGLGPAAHSFQGNRRWRNYRTLKRYLKSLAAGRAPVAGRETLSADQLRLEALYLGLRTKEGVDLGVIRHSPGSETALARLQADGLVEVKGGRVCPTRRGFLVADRLPLYFG